MRIRVKVTEIVQLARSALLQSGLSEADTEIILDHLLDGELSGHPSHGFFRVPGIVRAARQTASSSEIQIEQESHFAVMLNGGNRQGLVVAFKGTDLAIQKAQQSKIALVGGHNYVGTTGAMGYFTRRIADSGLIGVMIATSAEGVSPWGGCEMILGTNPISISVPSAEDPVVVDLATAKWSYGDLSLAMIENRRIPEGVVLDKEGNPSTDPQDADNGSQMPMAEHKGYALGLAVELLAGPFVGAKAGVKAVPGSDGFAILAVATDVFVPSDVFREQTTALIEEIKKSKRRPGVDEIYYPGERSQRKRLENGQAEEIEMVSEVFEKVRMLAAS